MKPVLDKFRITILVCITLLNTTLFAQCYKSNIDVGKQNYSAGKYVTAKKYFTTSLKCPDAKGGVEAKQWIQKCNNKIVEQKRVAEERRIAEEKRMAEERRVAEEKRLAEERRVLEQNKKPKIEWAIIPAGTFIMGSPISEVDRGRNEIQHQVTLSGFKMSKHEVTFDLYDAFCDATNRVKPDDEGWGRGNRPVINISWDDANAFAKWMGCRLPTEAEWEYACRAGTTTPFNAGNNLTTSQANYNGNHSYNGNSKGTYMGKTIPVGNYSPNAWGLYDMHGNVWEWCSDWDGDYLEKAQINPTGSYTGIRRVLRGGSWGGSAHGCRSACRNSESSNAFYNFIGFRLVSSL